MTLSTQKGSKFQARAPEVSLPGAKTQNHDVLAPLRLAPNSSSAV